MLTQQHIQESLSQAYVRAVAGMAGVNLAPGRIHDYGIDGTFRSIQIVRSRRVETGYGVDFQLKATINWHFDGTDVVYDLESKTYNDLVTRESEATPCILILLCLPECQEDWIFFTEQELILKHCCYWAILKGDPTKNVSTRRIWIPRSQLLTAESVTKILDNERSKRIGTGHD